MPNNCLNCKALRPNMHCSLGYNNLKIPKGITPIEFKFSGTKFYGYPQEKCPKPLTEKEYQIQRSLKNEELK